MKLLKFLNSEELKIALRAYEVKKEEAKELEELRQLEEHKRALGLASLIPGVQPNGIVRASQSQPARNLEKPVVNRPPVPQQQSAITHSLSLSIPKNILSVLPSFNSK